MARIVVRIDKHLSDYSYGYGVDDVNIVYQDSNILTINTSGEYFIFVKNKRTGNVESKKKTFVMCSGGVPICNINVYPFVNTSICSIFDYPINKITEVNEVCTINLYPILDITLCNIEYNIIKLN